MSFGDIKLKIQWVKCYVCEEMYNDYDYDLTDDCVLCGAKNALKDV
jgi:hypothetical protein